MAQSARRLIEDGPMFLIVQSRKSGELVILNTDHIKMIEKVSLVETRIVFSDKTMISHIDVEDDFQALMTALGAKEPHELS